MNLASKTTEDLKSALRAAIAERGADYVYVNPNDPSGVNGCLYVHYDNDTGSPSCGCALGWVLHHWGMPLSELAVHEDVTANAVFGELGAPVDVRLDAGSFQADQDEGIPWGLAFRRVFGEDA